MNSQPNPKRECKLWFGKQRGLFTPYLGGTAKRGGDGSNPLPGGIAKRVGGLPIGSCSMCPVSRRSGCAFQPDARSLCMSKVSFTTIRVVKGLADTGGDLRSDRVRGRETGTIRSYPPVRFVDGCISGQTQGSAPTTIFAINFPDAMM